MIEFHVSPAGAVTGDGSPAMPYASLAQARDALRARRRAGQTRPATVWLRGGTYRLRDSFVLTPEDGGSAAAPVTYRAWPGEEVRLSGGIAIPASALRPVEDPRLAACWGPAAAGHIRQVDLAALGVTDTGGHEPFGFAWPERPGYAALYDRDRPLPLARWPREGTARTGAVLDPGEALGDPSGGILGVQDPAHPPRGATFGIDPALVRRWANPGDLLCHGAWTHDWAPATVPVRALDAVRGLLTLATPVYCSVKEGRPFQVLNAIEEIAQPGDWAVDRVRNILYLYPPAPAEALRLELSVLEQPLVRIEAGVRHAVLRDLVFECARGLGVVIEGEDCLLAGCTLRNLGWRGADVTGARNRVQSCHIHATGQGGVRLAGGDRRTLTPSGHVAENNEIHDFNRLCKTYNSAIWPQGCGHRIAHNRIYDGPHNAILLHGNDHLIEYNEFHHLCLESDDASAIYTGRNPSELGHIIRYNFFHHIGAPTGWGTSAIYSDDGSCGLTVSGNVFYRCGHAGQVCMGAFFANGGNDHVLENNVFVDCGIAVGLMQMTPAGWLDYLHEPAGGPRGIYRALYEAVDIRSELYRRRYPALADLEEHTGRNIIRRNLAVRCGLLVTPEERQVIADNWCTGGDPGFADAARLDFTLSARSEAFERIPGFAQIPFREIGLRVDAYRASLPPRHLVDCRPELVEAPPVQGPGETVPARQRLHFANLSDASVSGLAELWTNEPGTVRFDRKTVPYSLAPGEVCIEAVDLDVTARPDQGLHAGVRLADTPFTLPVPIRLRYRIALPRRDGNPALDAADALLADTPPLAFLRGADRPGEIRLAALSSGLVFTAALTDSRPLQDRPVDGMWNGPFLGLLAAPPDARDTAAVRQPVFFVHGPADTGTLWFFEGARQIEPPRGIQWRVEARTGGWTIRGVLPWVALGLPETPTAFRLEAMANLVLPGATAPALVTLFGSKPARLELATLADVDVVHAAAAAAAASSGARVARQVNLGQQKAKSRP